jgi:hypothetical protein
LSVAVEESLVCSKRQNLGIENIQTTRESRFYIKGPCGAPISGFQT